MASDTETAGNDTADDARGHDLAFRMIGLAAMSIRAELDSAQSGLAKNDTRRAERAIRECGRHLDEIDAALDGDEPAERWTQGDLLIDERSVAELLVWARGCLAGLRKSSTDPRTRSVLRSVLAALHENSNPRLRAALERQEKP